MFAVSLVTSTHDPIARRNIQVGIITQINSFCLLIQLLTNVRTLHHKKIRSQPRLSYFFHSLPGVVCILCNFGCLPGTWLRACSVSCSSAVLSCTSHLLRQRIWSLWHLCHYGHTGTACFFEPGRKEALMLPFQVLLLLQVNKLQRWISNSNVKGRKLHSTSIKIISTFFPESERRSQKCTWSMQSIITWQCCCAADILMYDVSSML